MYRRKGLHFYINVNNFNDIVENEEQHGGVNHSIHALDTLFSLTEQFGKTNYPEALVVEKITGARLHLFVYGNVKDSFAIASSVISYAYSVAKFMSSDIAKYKSLLKFELQSGLAHGRFYEYEFRNEAYEEMTTIGFACNYAAKLQSLASTGSIAISSDVFNAIDIREQLSFVRKTSPSIIKYKQSYYYEARINQLKSRIELSDKDKDGIRYYANKQNLTDMKFSKATRSLNLERLSPSNGRRIEGIPVFADVRNFTSQFKPDDSNLSEMAEKTKQILERLYNITTKNNGIHIQFQGDREFALYHNIGDNMCFSDAVLGGMRMIDAVKPYAVHIGVGESFGKMYAVRIGARGEKDYLIIGRTVNTADKLEDSNAGEDQLAISAEVYDGLKQQNPELARQFHRVEGHVYITTQGYKAYTDHLKFTKQALETKGHGYNGAWGTQNGESSV